MSDDDVSEVFQLLNQWMATTDPDEVTLIKSGIMEKLSKRKKCNKRWGSGRQCDALAHPGKTKCLHHIKAWQEYSRRSSARKRLQSNPNDIGALIILDNATNRIKNMKRKAKRKKK